MSSTAFQTNAKILVIVAWILCYGTDGFAANRVSDVSCKLGRSEFYTLLYTKGNDKVEDASIAKSKKESPYFVDDGIENKDLEEEPDLPSWVRAITKWPSQGSARQQDAAKVDKTEPHLLVVESPNAFENTTATTTTTTTTTPSADAGGWLMDPILRSIFKVQELLPRPNETAITATTATSGNFLDLLDTRNGNGMSQMEALLDSLEDAALLVNVSTTTPGNVPREPDLFDDGWKRWDRWVGSMQKALQGRGATTTGNLTSAAEGILRQATARIESMLAEAGTLPAVWDVANATALAALAVERSVDLNEAVEQAQQLGNFAAQLKGVADGLLRQGYVSKEPVKVTMEGAATTVAKLPVENRTRTQTSKTSSSRRRQGALFQDFSSASEQNVYTPILGQAAEMAAMSGVIYEQTVPRSLQLGHSIAARGVSMDVRWMVTDSLASHSEVELMKDRIDNDRSEPPLLIRTITIRGFDASDEEVDRELLVTRICTANPKPLTKIKGVQVHAGLWEIAKAVYRDIKQYIDWTTPQHKIVLAGHSIGGSVANLVLFLITMERGADFVQERILRVYTFGSPPVAAVANKPRSSSAVLRCDVLKAFGLPVDTVWAFIQPWDPICRLFSEIDSLYPLIGDMGPDSDGVTPWPKGPPRTLRPVAKAILEAWDGWPRFRDSWYETGAQNYAAVGIQHVLLPEATRYLTDRFLTVSIAVPPVRSLLRLSPTEIYPALATAFPLDVFEISYVPQAIRG
eukprot:scaffold5899_cov167-Amphora_coffeaeformis.AAC.3